IFFFFFSSRRRHTRSLRDWSSDVCSSDLAEYSEETASELAIVHAAARAHAHYGRQCITHYIVSMAQSVSDLLEVHILLKEAGLRSEERRVGKEGKSRWATWY